MTSTTITTIKNLAYFPAILLGLSSESYTILVVFMTLDIILGVTRVIVLHGGEHIKSYRLSTGIISKLLVLLIPLLLVWTGKGINVDMFFLAQWSLGALILAEAYSIFGNIHAIRIKEDIPEFDAISWVIRRIQVVIGNILRNGMPLEKQKGSFKPTFSPKKPYERKP